MTKFNLLKTSYTILFLSYSPDMYWNNICEGGMGQGTNAENNEWRKVYEVLVSALLRMHAYKTVHILSYLLHKHILAIETMYRTSLHSYIKKIRVNSVYSWHFKSSARKIAGFMLPSM